jgi:hypothetical protein
VSAMVVRRGGVTWRCESGVEISRQSEMAKAKAGQRNVRDFCRRG